MSQSTRIIQRRIKSSKNIAQITKAMEMVSASKMKRAQQMALSSRPYTDRMYQVITSLSRSAKQQVDHFLLKDPRIHWDEDQELNLLIILMSTDKSLCGGLNTNLFRGLEKFTKDLKTTYHLPPKFKVTYLTIGKKSKEHVLKTSRLLVAEFPGLGDKPKFQDVLPISKLVIDGFRQNDFHMAFLVYMKFISTISQALKVKQLLPIQPESIETDTKHALEELDSDYVFEPQPAEIFEKLLPQYVELQLYHTLLESLASEHSARMVAMKNASDNAADIVKDLSLEFNQARQSKITGELLDVVSARMTIE